MNPTKFNRETGKSGKHHLTDLPALPVQTPLTGFTLIELLAVITIIGLLAGLVLGIAGYAQQRAATNRAQAEIAEMNRALEAYMLDLGQYPTSSVVRGTSTTDALTNSWLLFTQLAATGSKYITFSKGQYRVSALGTFLVDPFGNPYNYYRLNPATNAQRNRVSFDLWSYGPDGLNNTPDDVTNWK